MRLCYLGNEERLRYLQEAASPGVIVERLTDFTPTVGRPETIESLYDEALLAPWNVEMAVEAERREFDAVITDCVGELSYTTGRPFEHDPAVPQLPLPSLQEVTDLVRLAPDAHAARLLHTRLVRQRNRVVFGLQAAADALGGALATVR